MDKKTIIEIIIGNITVDERNYGFDFIVNVNGKERLNGNYDDDYDGGDIEYIKKSLEDGMAEDLILENYGHGLFNY